MSNFYNSIPILKNKRSTFNLGYTHKTTLDMGMIIPIGNWICYPNEKYKLGNSAVIRLQPLNAPLLHRIKVRTATFFVPWRIIWEDYEKWANSGVNGEDLLTKELPLWDDYYSNGSAPQKYSLWDYLGRNTLTINNSTKDPTKSFVPNDLLRRAYNKIINEYFINRNIEPEVAENNNDICYANFKNDYFASALPFQQRSEISPAIALSINDAPIVFDNDVPIDTNGNTWIDDYNTHTGYAKGTEKTYDIPGTPPSSITVRTAQEYAEMRETLDGLGLNLDRDELNGKRYRIGMRNSNYTYMQNIDDKYDQGLKQEFNYIGLKADNSKITSSFDAQELRLLMQTQKFLERNARCGSRYAEQLLGRWGIFSGDARLQRPEFIYSTSNNIVVEELPQLSEDGTTPQGHLVGKGTGAQINPNAGYYTTHEHGCIMQMLWIMPDLDYIPQGYDRETLIKTRLDEYAPEFAHLSEQMIKKGELYFSGIPEDDNAMFGYEPIWSELRHRRNVVSGDMRNTFDYWHLGRKFENQPALNKDFIKVNGTSEEFKRIFATGTSAQGFIIGFANQCICARPLPKYGTPGLVDHF